MTLKRTQSADEIAEILDVNVETVRGWAGEGCPHKKQGKRLWFNDGEVHAWLNQTGRSAKPGRPPKPKPEPSADREGDKDYWLARKYKNQCLKDEGALIAVEDVNRCIGEHFGTTRNKLIGLGAALAPHLEGRDTAERQVIIETRIREILEELSSEINRIANSDGVKAAA